MDLSYILPVWRRGTVYVIIPVADSELLIEAGLVGAHIGNPAAILVTHVENLIDIIMLGLYYYAIVEVLQELLCILFYFKQIITIILLYDSPCSQTPDQRRIQ